MKPSSLRLLGCATSSGAVFGQTQSVSGNSLRISFSTTRTPKVTLPSPRLFANLWSPEVSAGVYPTLESLLSDVTQILRNEICGETRWYGR